MSLCAVERGQSGGGHRRRPALARRSSAQCEASVSPKLARVEAAESGAGRTGQLAHQHLLADHVEVHAQELERRGQALGELHQRGQHRRRGLHRMPRQRCARRQQRPVGAIEVARRPREAAAVDLEVAHASADHVGLDVGRHVAVRVAQQRLRDHAARHLRIEPFPVDAAVILVQPAAHARALPCARRRGATAAARGRSGAKASAPPDTAMSPAAPRLRGSRCRAGARCSGCCPACARCSRARRSCRPA